MVGGFTGRGGRTVITLHFIFTIISSICKSCCQQVLRMLFSILLSFSFLLMQIELYLSYKYIYYIMVTVVMRI